MDENETLKALAHHLRNGDIWLTTDDNYVGFTTKEGYLLAFNTRQTKMELILNEGEKTEKI